MSYEYMPESIIIVDRQMGNIGVAWICPYNGTNQIYCTRENCEDCGIKYEREKQKQKENEH